MKWYCSMLRPKWFGNDFRLSKADGPSRSPSNLSQTPPSVPRVLTDAVLEFPRRPDLLRPNPAGREQKASRDLRRVHPCAQRSSARLRRNVGLRSVRIPKDISRTSQSCLDAAGTQETPPP